MVPQFWLEHPAKIVRFNEVGCGAAYIFANASGIWTQQAILTANDQANEDRFGSAVALDGDRAIIGVPFDDDNNEMNSGAIHIYEKPATGWVTSSISTKLTGNGASSNVFDGNFGSSVSLSGNRVLVGAPYNNDSCPNPVNDFHCGHAYLYEMPTPPPPDNETILSANDAASHDKFGVDVAIDGDTAAVLSEDGCDDVGVPQCGAIYVYTYNAPTWTQQAKLTISSTHRIGSIALEGDTIAAGIPYEACPNRTECGALYIFEKPANGWATTSTADAKLTSSRPVAGEHVGSDIDIDNDTIVVGAPRRPCASGTAFEYCGAVYVFEKPGATWVDITQTAILTASDGLHRDELGVQVAIDGNTIVAGRFW